MPEEYNDVEEQRIARELSDQFGFHINSLSKSDFIILMQIARDLMTLGRRYSIIPQSVDAVESSMTPRQ